MATTRRKPAPRKFPTFYVRAYAPGAVSLDGLSRQMGHRVSSIAEYTQDLAKQILHDQVGYSKAQREMATAEALEELENDWAELVAPAFRLELFSNAGERDEYPTGVRRKTKEILADVFIDFEAPADWFFSDVDPKPAANQVTPAQAKISLLQGARGGRAIYRRLEDFGFLDPLVAVYQVFLDGANLEAEVREAVKAKRFPPTDPG